MRLDFLVSQRLNVSRTKAQGIVKNGDVSVDGRIINKPSFEVDGDENIIIERKDNYVSRGAYKLIRAVEFFNLDLNDRIVLDMGASTGGFTQVALENGASKVYSVDVGHGELDRLLCNNERVVNMEGRDIRTLTGEEVGDADIVVGDLSFISLIHILPKIKSLFGKIECALLYKPQFECGKEVAKKHKGVIKDKVIHKKLLRDFAKELKVLDFELSNLTYSSIKGKEGNIEYLLHLNGKTRKEVDIDRAVEEAFSVL